MSVSLTNGNASNQNGTSEPVRTRAGFEWKSRAKILGIPLICVSFGRDERGRRRIAKGFLAVGNYAVGGIAIGQFALGIFGIGQFALGLFAAGQLALALMGGFGQFAVGVFAVGQFVAGFYAKGQFGWGTYLWTPGRTDMEAVAMFGTIDWLVQQDFATICETLSDAFKFYLP